MVWFLVDDNLALHKKVIEAGNAAMGVWVRAGAWSAGNLTDGYVPSNVARQIGDQYSIKKLINAGLWSRVTGGYQFHDWADRQPTAELVKQRRDSARKRKQSQRDREKSVTPPVTRDPHARGRPSPLKDLGSLPHQRAGPAPPAPPPQRGDTGHAADWAQAIADCELCDDTGMRLPRCALKCDHIDHAQTAANGMNQIRAALQKKPQKITGAKHDY